MDSSPESSEHARKVRFGGRSARSAPSKSAERTMDDEDSDDDDDDVGLAKTVMAITSYRAAIGCAYFSPGDGTLYLLQDAHDAAAKGWDFASLGGIGSILREALTKRETKPSTTVVEQVQPDLLLVNEKSDDELIDTLQETLTKSKSLAAMPPVIQIRPGREFSKGGGESGLQSLDVVTRADGEGWGWKGFAGESGGLTLAAVSALLTSLHSSLPSPLPIHALQAFLPSDYLLLPSQTLSSLQIFSSQSHANVHSTKTLEGLSLFGILSGDIKTNDGRSRLRSWVARPLKVKEDIEDRLDAVECFLLSSNAHHVQTLGLHLKSIKNLPRTLGVIDSGKGKARDWETLLRTCFATVELVVCLNSLKQRPENGVINRIMQHPLEDLNILADTISSIIDFEESRLQSGRVCVLPRVDGELDELRTKYAGLEPMLDHIAQNISGEMEVDGGFFNIVYFPQIGYLCTVPSGSEPGLYEAQGWEIQWSTETQSYYKNPRMRDLDNHLGDLKGAIDDREIEIVHALEEKVKDYGPFLRLVASDLADLDCLLALAEVAKRGEWVRPKITEDNVIRIKGGRHPLVEACVDAYVVNDTTMRGGRGVNWDGKGDAYTPPTDSRLDPNLSLLLLTGANFSGKSAYLKQVALITILAQIGSFVPAAQAVVGMRDAVYTRVATRESVSRGESAFGIDLQEVSYMLRNCTARSMLLIDEFGKGTDMSDGQGLFCGVVQHLINRGAECPMTLIATHFHAVFTNNILPSNLPINFAHMQVLLPPNMTKASAPVTYLYRLAPSLTTHSHALSCAALFGIPLHVRQRAQRVSDLIGRFDVISLIDVGMGEDEVRTMKANEALVRRFLAEEDESLEDATDMKAWLGRLIDGEEGSSSSEEMEDESELER